ncbi:MAG: undecaprenyl-diphosphate phosphatase [Eubacteriales bacterium]|nr:undecaprenyl-diphosphate phosphatase [Eubacteriales bacterium]MDY3332923.1 undecaprenyl-diphosphate phosphatase [Gallibacter sp.]
MLSSFEAIILGLVQGLGEFLPISSSGHLALLQAFFKIDGEKVLFFAVMLHLGTLISVFIVYWSDIVALIKELGAVFKDIFSGKGLRVNANPTRKLGFLIIVATIPTALIGLLFNDIFGSLYNSIVAVGCGLIFTGIILIIAEKMSDGRKEARGMLFRSAIFVGVLQGLAIAPGISRSGSTLFAGLVTRLDRAFAVKFAFLISIPSILGSVVLELPKALKAGIDSTIIFPMTLGVLVSAISGFFAIKFMIKIVSNKKLSFFSYYVWALGALVIIYGIIFI